MLTGFMLLAMAFVFVGDVSAQFATCAAPAVAYQPVTAYRPVVAQPVVAYQPYTGWYLGRWFDKRRMRRAATTAAYTVAYGPSATPYAPTYTAAYAPTYTAAYRPYVTSFAPMARPAPAPFYPIVQTVARPVLMQPVLAAPACNTCSFTPACGCAACSTGCDSCSTGVLQADFTEPACSSCVGGGQAIDVVPEGTSSGNVGPQTPKPSLPDVPAQGALPFQSNRPTEASGAQEGDSSVDDDVDPAKEPDPGPAATEEDASTYYNAPRLLDPRDRTARSTNSRKPTVDVWNAVYRKSATGRKLSPKLSPVGNRQARTPAERRPQLEPRTQAEIDADGWSAVPRNR